MVPSRRHPATARPATGPANDGVRACSDALRRGRWRPMSCEAFRAPSQTMKLLVVGDTHANTAWWDNAVAPLAQRLGVGGIIQVGDFGYWPLKPNFMATAVASPVPVWFLDGNHEHHPALAADVTAARAAAGIDDPRAPVPLGGSLIYLPRGARLRLGQVDFAALGGARSINRADQNPGVDWFPEEAVSNDDLEVVIAGGPADVLLSHDAPSGYMIPGLLPDWQLSTQWQAELPSCQEHRGRIREALEALQPQLVIHGHYHQRYTTVLNEAWGKVSVEGLDCDGSSQAFLVVETDPMLTVTAIALTLP